MIKIPRGLAFAGTAMLVASVVQWCITAESSPARGYLLYHVALPNAWATINLLPFLAAGAMGGNIHAPPTWMYLCAFFIQWALAGVLAALVFQRFRSARGR
ncbi:hypothetical protein LYSHEL_26910 [Lysobacter helvus]|uniref:Uncharacterized protein n=2 Tax=Lysobacteraceae TaxID=32033 RepID=A0ABM7Q8A5_9GAMM|nr:MULTISPECIES: hypothetical protein [Lysobacter]BCT93664.1 hypothetical protein LYSCAS_26880 [Lysobacter caseinilyticus]BCT96820.1 hypothetical protein LYSHEL_26910 [Lysobacter helvus]